MFNTNERRLAFGEFQFDPVTWDLSRGPDLVPVTPKALSLLGYLVAHAGRLVSKHQLLDALWPDVFVSDGVLKVCVREIRRALGDDARAPRFIETAHRRGYRFIATVRELDAQPCAILSSDGRQGLDAAGAWRGSVSRGSIGLVEGDCGLPRPGHPHGAALGARRGTPGPPPGA